MTIKKIGVGSDHAGVNLKNKIEDIVTARKKKNKFQLFFNESYDCLAEIFLFNRFLQI